MPLINLQHTLFQAFRRNHGWFWLGLAVLCGLRFLHLPPLIDDPHTWRQADTAQYIWDFYQNGIDFFHPSVCWMGGHKTVILEFPLYEGIVALFYKAFGPDLIWARLVSLLFYFAGLRYFYRLVCLLANRDLAEWATLVYLSLPLGIFYSRAIHIDFSAIFFAHAMMYHFLVGIRDSNVLAVAVGVVWGTLGFWTKAPYLFFLALPILAYVHQQGKWRFLLRNSWLFALPAVLFVPWQWHVKTTNAAAPDWDFIPAYRKFDNMWDWYFGNWEMRKEKDLWLTIYGRLRWESLGVHGMWAILLALVAFPKRFFANAFRWWWLGACIYLVIFFNLNLIHDYYQIPFLAPAAALMGMLLWGVQNALGDRWKAWLGLLAFFVLCLFAANNIRMTERVDLDEAEAYYFDPYFQVKDFPIQVGEKIRAATPENALVISSYGGLDCRAPHILYRARRLGWSIPQSLMTPEILRRLREEGADTYALVTVHPDSPEMAPVLAELPSDTIELENTHWKLVLFDLNGTLEKVVVR